MRQSDTEV